MKQILLSLLVLLLLITGCTPKTVQTETKRVEYYNDKFLKFNIRRIPNVLDPSDYNDVSELIILNNVYEGLVREEGDSFSLAQANSYTVGDDYKTYTFRLRESYWTDNSPVTSRDFRETIINRKDDDPYNLINLLGIEQVLAPDDETIVFKLTRGNTNFIKYLSDPMFLPEKTSKGHHVYNGPYYVQRKSNSEIRLFKNQGYWNRKEIYLEVVEGLQMYFDEAYKAYNNKNLDLVLDIPIYDLNDLIVKEDNLIVFPQESVFCFIFNETVFNERGFGDENIKSHLFEAVDRKAIVENFDEVAMKAETVVIPKDLLEGTDQSEFWSFIDQYESQSSSSFVTSQGEGLINKLIEITIKGNSKDEYEISKLVRDMWKVNLGVETNVLVLDDNKYLRALEDKDFEVIAIKLNGIASDPLSYINMYHTDSNSNYGNYSNPVFDSNIESAYLAGERIRNIYIKKALVNLSEANHILAISGFDSAVIISNEFANFNKTKTGKIFFDQIQNNRKE